MTGRFGWFLTKVALVVSTPVSSVIFLPLHAKALIMNPLVGIYFVVKDQILHDSVTLENAEAYGDALQHGGHNDFHEDLAPQSPIERLFKTRPYDFYPRGRVVYFQQTGKFRLYVDKCLDEETIQKVIETFCLADLDIETEPDEHYKCAGCNRNYLI